MESNSDEEFQVHIHSPGSPEARPPRKTGHGGKTSKIHSARALLRPNRMDSKDPIILPNYMDNS